MAKKADVLVAETTDKEKQLLERLNKAKDTVDAFRGEVKSLNANLKAQEKDAARLEKSIAALKKSIESKNKKLDSAVLKLEKAKKAVADNKEKTRLTFKKEESASKKVLSKLKDEEKASATKKEKVFDEIKASDTTVAEKDKSLFDSVEKTEEKAVEEKHENTEVTEKLDVMISFDTTGSMYSVLANVRRDIKNTVKELFDTFGKENLRIALIAHGDYCDAGDKYVTQKTNFFSDPDPLCTFVSVVQNTYGGDSDECYELVLKTATEMPWRDDAKKILIMVGDANPHEVGYRYRALVNELDWRKEADKLASMGVQIYGVHAMHNYRNSSAKFYHTISEKTNGVYLTLDNFSDVLQIISATCYKNHSEESYAAFIDRILKAKEGTRTLWNNIRRLNGEAVDDSDASGTFRVGKSAVVRYKTLPGLHVVPAGRFQVISVEDADSIKGFVEKNGITYKVGKAFYELTKTEEVQQYKEIILQDKVSGDMYYGDDARKHLGLKPQCERKGAYAHEKIKPVKDDEYRVFIQSTSVNRKLVAGTHLLYEVEDI